MHLCRLHARLHELVPIVTMVCVSVLLAHVIASPWHISTLSPPQPHAVSGEVLLRPRICMYICMYYVCVCACMYVCLHVCMYVCMYACMYACMYTMHAFMHVCMYMCIYMYVYMYNTQVLMRPTLGEAGHLDTPMAAGSSWRMKQRELWQTYQRL